MDYSYSWEAILSPGKALDFFQTEAPQPFKVQKTEFSHTNGWWLSELSRLIYLKGDSEADPASQTATRNSFLQQVGLQEIGFYNGKHLQCAVVTTMPEYGQDFNVLVFRGTQGGFSSWFYNLSTTLSPWPAGGEVHRGFKLLLLEAWDGIQQLLEKARQPLYYTGHSLGGALAVLTASLANPEAVYTFGAPRLGNTEFIDTTKGIEIYRVANSRDIVANVPPIPNILHVGELHGLTTSRANDTQRSWFDAPVFLADHSPLNYSNQL